MTGARPNAAAIRQAKIDNPKMRERELAASLGISEAEYVEAWTGRGVFRITTDFARIFPRIEELGPVTALTRNENAVHEKIGIYDSFRAGKHAAMMLGAEIDMRMFPRHWAYGFAVENDTGEMAKRSFQFFDAHGEALHKIHLRADSNFTAWKALAAELAAGEDVPPLAITPASSETFENDTDVPFEELRTRWSAMTDTHQFPGLLNTLKLSRHKAVSSIGSDYAWKLDRTAILPLLEGAAAMTLPIMCFVGNRGCIQIHSGPVQRIATMGPWLNVMDETFHLHLRQDRIAEVWAVRKPVDKGHVTSVEAFDVNGELIIQFFGKRIEGQDERGPWRSLVETLPVNSASQAA
ncbi:hemin-degrading factor [Rhizobium sp. C4]|uniref:hemin-degrading factor n=1 Tax=Rhizobium sp. C4 TaxID=1349800 RepID=UPI001E566844|nr:ChuX/HutX family heme-like substrate-binding protein [Rhizobium sp. C4]MCD2172087.1 hemin-degrading factor [Rhizobium sp. C4]